MIKHLHQEYGTMMAQDIIDNPQKLCDDFDISTSIVTYFYKIREIRKTAQKAGQPITDGELLTEIYLIMDPTGIFDKAINEWDTLPPVQKTWVLPESFPHTLQKVERKTEETGTANFRTSQPCYQRNSYSA